MVETEEILEDDKLGLGRFSLWIFAAEFPTDDGNPKLSRLCFCGSVSRFTVPAFVALLLTV